MNETFILPSPNNQSKAYILVFYDTAFEGDTFLVRKKLIIANALVNLNNLEHLSSPVLYLHFNSSL